MSLWERTLSERGHHTKIVDIEKDTKGELIKEINEKANVTITWNSNCRNVKVGAGNFYLNELKAKNLCRLTEHPIAFFLDYWNTRGQNQYYITCNVRHNALIEEQRLGTVVATSKLTGLKTEGRGKKTILEKEYSMVIAAQNRGDPRDLIFWAEKSKQTQEFYESIIRNALFNDKTDVYKEYKNKIENLTQKNILLIEHHFVLKKLYWIQKKYERNLIIDWIINNLIGKKLLIGNWEGKYSDRKDVKVMRHVSPERITDIYKKAQTVLCVNELDGGNERVYEAGSIGAHSIGDAWLYANSTQPDALDLFSDATNKNSEYLTERICDEDNLMKWVENI